MVFDMIPVIHSTVFLYARSSVIPLPVYLLKSDSTIPWTAPSKMPKSTSWVRHWSVEIWLKSQWAWTAALTSLPKDVTLVLLFQGRGKCERWAKSNWPPECNITSSAINILPRKDCSELESKPKGQATQPMWGERECTPDGLQNWS